MAEEGRDPERDRCPCDYGKLVELKEQVDKLSGQVVSLTERVARLEEENRWLRQEIAEIKGNLGGIRRNVWVLLASSFTILVTALIDLLLRLPIAH